MTGKGPKTAGKTDAGSGSASARERRSAEALRANLRRRKAQVRDRAETTEEPADEPPPPPPASDPPDRP